MSQPILKMHVDSSAFEKAARDLFKTSSRTWPEFVNGQLYGLALKALNMTAKAFKDKIRAELSQPAHNTWEIDGSDTLATRIINARLKAAGRPLLWGPDLNRAAARLIAARTRATSFIKSGWLPAIQDLARFVKGATGRRDRDAKIRGRPKGSVSRARPTTGVVVGTITNTALREPYALEIAERGLRMALSYQTADMIETLKKRVQKDIEKAK